MYAGIDLGSTNIKCAIYDRDMRLLARESAPVDYYREGGVVEFDALSYAKDVVSLVKRTMESAGTKALRGMAFTGQAETLVVLGADGKPLRRAISWMDDRSTEECAELEKLFPHEVCEAKTGQMAVLPTWPATKILWLRRHEPETYEKAASYMLLKDYVVYYLTGEKCSDMSIATFSFYFDIYNKCWWKEMLQAIGVRESQLPPLCEPLTVAGNLLPQHKEALGLSENCFVSVGTLDHFAGMIGTGNLAPGGITLSTGTVMAMATLCREPIPKSCGIAMHYGFLPDTWIMLPVAESGGVSLEWFKRACVPNNSFREIDDVVASRQRNDLLFLPYIVGTSAPEFDMDASGAFLGLRDGTDAFDMAAAVMEGVAYVLRKNCEEMAEKGSKPEAIIATGGGAKSAVWCQFQADITGLPVRVPLEKEAACLGSAMIAATMDGRFESLKDAAELCVSMVREYTPDASEEEQTRLTRKFKKFCAFYDAALQVTRMN